MDFAMTQYDAFRARTRSNSDEDNASEYTSLIEEKLNVT